MVEKIITELEEFITINRQEVSPKGFITVSGYECQLANGKTLTREKIQKNGKDGSAAIIVPYTKDNKILIVAEPRVFTELTVGVGFPAGYLESDEDMYECAKRELYEETGYQAKDIILLDSFYQDEGCSSALNYIFLAKGCVKVGKQHLDPYEYIKYFECSYEDVLELEKRGYIKGCNSKLAIEKIKRKIK